MTPPPRIAIVGAGPAGLTLARLLQVAASDENVALNITIYEKDASPASRAYQGGSLDLHPPTGLAAMKACKLWDEFLKYARYEGEELIITDKNGTEFVHMKEAMRIEGFEARPEIDRERLKNILLDSVDSSWIKWGKHLRSVTEDGMLVFDDDTSGPFDLVVGAEGGWSKVARMVTDVRPAYSGISGIQGTIPKPNEEHPDLSKLIGRGSYFAFSDSKSIMAQRMGNESLKVGVWLRQDENFPAKLIAEAGSSDEKLKEKILEHYQDWVPEITQGIDAGTSFRPWVLYELPVDHRWEHKKGFTLIGDAAHLMTPFAGEGVNTAMKDALELSGAIIASQKTQVPLDTVVHLFEEDMFPRMNKIWQTAKARERRLFSLVIGMKSAAGILRQNLPLAADEGRMLAPRMTNEPINTFVNGGRGIAKPPRQGDQLSVVIVLSPGR